MSVAGGKMKATKLWIRPNKDATNSSGFSAFPPKSNSHSSSVDYAHFWSRDPGQRDKISIFYVCNYTSEVQINYTHDWSRISVRCVKD